MRVITAVAELISTFFYVGYLPFIPGSFASLAALWLAGLVRGDCTLYLALTASFIILGFSCSGRAEKALGVKDSPHIVIDEVSGMFISLLFVPQDIRLTVLAFLLFRIFDTLKPFPAGHLQKLKGAKGIMADDIIAGLYTNLVLQLALRLTALRAS